jgi:hypothetical protein
MFKILSTINTGFESVTDHVKTEQNVFNLMVEKNILLPDNFGYIGIPLADNINKKGIKYTQDIIDNIQNKYPNFVKKFICQHIHTPLLNFYDNIVFTPHTLLKDSYKCIPHYNNIIKKHDFVEVEKRKFKFSFFGSYNTHLIRKELDRYNSKETPIIDTGSWHYYKDDNHRNLQERSYIQNLTNTVFNLCPQGTGSSTIRLYESMACGSIPVLFNDVKVPDCVQDLCLRTTIENLQYDIENFNNTQQKCKQIYENYWKYLYNRVIFEYILNNV